MNQPAASSFPENQDERVMAALAHASIIIPNIGVIVPLIIWLTQRERSRVVAFQALQALVYHVVLIIGWFAFAACFVGSILVFSFTSFGLNTYNTGNTLLVAFPFLLFCLLGLLSLAFIVYGVIAAVQTLQGQDFHYALIGNWLARNTQRA